MKKRWVVYGAIYLFIVFAALGTLAMNIRTMGIASEHRVVKKQLKKIQAENRRLLLEITSANALAELDRLAVEEYDLKPPKKVIYIESN